jgi:Cu2+-exporting ATPase
MTFICKHCATPYTEGSGVGGFCCPGCQQVYLLIQDEGFEDYYRFQDRAAQPIKDRMLADPDVSALRCVQAEVEGGADLAQVAFEVEGMSCMGCAWLIERLAANQAGLIKAEVSLSRHLLTLQWRSADFDLPVYCAELFKFGYRMNPKPIDPLSSPLFSPLALRCLLSLIFTGNALLLVAFDRFVLPAGEAGTLISLLSMVCLCFTLLLGAATYFLSVYRSFQIRRWHSDWIPVALILGAAAYIGYEIYVSRFAPSFGVFLVSLLVSILIGARWLGAKWSS